MAPDTAERPSNPEVQHENQRPAANPDGKPPRPATEPVGGQAGAGASKTRTDKTVADPGSGEN